MNKIILTSLHQELLSLFATTIGQYKTLPATMIENASLSASHDFNGHTQAEIIKAATDLESANYIKVVPNYLDANLHAQDVILLRKNKETEQEFLHRLTEVKAEQNRRKERVIQAEIMRKLNVIIKNEVATDAELVKKNDEIRQLNNERQTIKNNLKKYQDIITGLNKGYKKEVGYSQYTPLIEPFTHDLSKLNKLKLQLINGISNLNQVDHVEVDKAKEAFIEQLEKQKQIIQAKIDTILLPVAPQLKKLRDNLPYQQAVEEIRRLEETLLILEKELNKRRLEYKLAKGQLRDSLAAPAKKLAQNKSAMVL